MKPGWLFVLPWKPEAAGGVNRVVIELCKQLSREGKYQPYILVADWSAPSPIIKKYAEYTEIRLRLRGNHLLSLTNLKRKISYLLALPRALYMLKFLYSELKICVVNPHYPTEIFSNFRLLRRYSSFPRLVVSFHGSDILGIEHQGQRGVHFWRKMLVQADAVVACSAGFQSFIDKVFCGGISQLTHINNGLSSSYQTRNIDQRQRLPDSLVGKKYLLCVGAFEAIKGHDLLIEAFNLLRERHPDLELVLIGRKGELIDKCHTLIASRGLSSRVTIFFDIPHEELKTFYLNAAIFVSPSHHESFPLCLLESAAMKTPVVTTNTIGGREIIENNIDGIIVEPGSVVALAEGINRMLENGELHRKCAESLYHKTMTRFTWESAVHQYVELVRCQEED